jgi:hypothetical protein
MTEAAKSRMRCVLGCLLGALALAAPTQAAARGRPTFACSWAWTLQDGFRPDYVTSGDSASCAVRHGSLVLSTRLEEWDASAHTWRTARFQRHTWTNLKHRHGTIADKRCDGGRYRARFTWQLRSGGTVVSHLAITKGPITAPVSCGATVAP